MTKIQKEFGVMTVIWLLCTVAACIVLIPGTSAKDPKPERLYRVKTIWIEPVNGREKLKTIEICLQKELESRGFQIVDDRATADAILKGTVEAEVVLDGGPEDAPKAIYEFQLMVSGEPIWGARVKFRSKPTFAEDNEYAALKLAQKLQRDSRNSAKRAGLR